MPYRNIRLHPFLRLIYFAFRILVWAGVSVFYRKRIVLGRENFRFDGPAIIVVNHPSTLMDVLNPGLPIRQEMFFLANYGLFKHPVSNWVFSRLFCIPVKRREDVAEGEERNNYAAFLQSFKHLEQNGVLFIAAEGTSWMYRRVREFKTGAARVAFGAESRNDWNLDVKIIPVGLSYSAPDLFRSTVVVNCGEAVYPRDRAGEWQLNAENAVASLTDELRRRVTALAIHTRDDEGEIFIGRLEEMLKNERPLPFRESFFRTKNLAETELDNPALRQKTALYFEALHNAGLSDEGVAARQAPNARRQTFLDGLSLAAGFLPFAIGYVFWFLPCYLPWLAAKKLGLYAGYNGMIKMLAGLITFPAALWAAGKYLPAIFGWENAGFLTALLMLFSGWFAERYLDIARRVRERRKAARFARKNREKFDALANLRKAVLLYLEPPCLQHARSGKYVY